MLVIAKIGCVVRACAQIFSQLLSPAICCSCRIYLPIRTVFCDRCEQLFEPIAPKMFMINQSYILTVYALTRYSDPVRLMLYAKYRQDQAMVEKIAQLIWQRSAVQHLKIDCFIPIPLHWTRNVKRGFNQAEILANYFSQQSQIPVLHALKRVRATQYQVRVENVDRHENVKDAFCLVQNLPMDLKGKYIMLVDDSCTTGSTAIQAAKVLAKLKPASINMIVACRAL